MKSFVCERYGLPDVLKEKEVVKPIPKGDQVLVKIVATSINSADIELLKGHPLIRIGSPFRPSNKVLGSDVSGIIESIGPDVSKFKTNDEVYADTSAYKFGAFAEYVCVSQEALREKPSNLTFIEAAAIPSAAVLAYQALDGINLDESYKVLINGAGGGLGTYAIQIAKSFGAEVTGVDNSFKQEKMKELGANFVIDYKKVDFANRGILYDVIVDCHGARSIRKIKKSLKKSGYYVLVGGKIRTIFATLIASKRKSTQKISVLFAKYNDKEYLEGIQKLIKTGRLHPVIDKVYNLSELKDACYYYLKGEFFGKIILVNDYDVKK